MAEARALTGPGGACVGAVVGAFVAGCIGVLVFHQLAWGLLHLTGISPVLPYRLRPIGPLGVPQVLSQASWGGLWGIVLAPLLAHRRGNGYWLFAMAFGLIGPTLVGWCIVPLLKGTPLMGGPPWMIQVVLPLPTLAWGYSAALVLKLLPASFVWRSERAGGPSLPFLPRSTGGSLSGGATGGSFGILCRAGIGLECP
jgi:hypothetical protein